MERFWRTLREGCVDFLGSLSQLHDVNVRLWAFLDQHYHRAPHAGLFGKSPREVFEVAPPSPRIDERAVHEALTVRVRRRVRRDTTISFEGKDYELDKGHLAGRLVYLCRSLADLSALPWVEFETKHFEVHPVDPVKNSQRTRPCRTPNVDESLPSHPAFDPPKALLDRAVGKKPRQENQS